MVEEVRIQGTRVSVVAGEYTDRKLLTTKWIIMVEDV